MLLSSVSGNGSRGTPSLHLLRSARQMNTGMSRTGSRRGGDRNDHQAKVGDLSKFGQISKGAPMTFGPSSVFAGKKESKRESLSRTNSNANMFQMLQNVEAAEI
ncbi:uncharacterized protein C8R40DRAFT_1104199 [Lentinula edodes]|uniref:uncharacterized protein n=1 Tax=Lentinula edodes TaxID=5353 RepID=UPI001E8D82A5|nr:uncharacterized protein C8R40DRAFT_1104199 [Lentinula edodes]KAH7875446.1 hypothetical protein C8R40DRAFT_1104199 [Lentinula edodes]